MTSSNAPSETDFWTKHVEALQTCIICCESFDHVHIPLRFIGKDACPHVFGSPCLRKWSKAHSENANKCPICRRVLWKSDDPNHITNSSDRRQTQMTAQVERSNIERINSGNSHGPVSAYDQAVPTPVRGSRQASSQNHPDDVRPGAEHADQEERLERLNRFWGTRSGAGADSLSTTSGANAHIIPLKGLPINVTIKLLDNMYNATAPGPLLPHNANESYMRGCMERSIYLTLEEAGYRHPFQVPSAVLDRLFPHFKSLVDSRCMRYRLDYAAVNEDYVTAPDIWKNVFRAFIEFEGL